MIKLILIGLVATAAVWFVTSKDHVGNLIEKDLTRRVADVLDPRGEKQLDFTVTDRDVIVFGNGDLSRKKVENLAVDARGVPGVERVFVIDSFADRDQISRAVVALTGQEQFTIAAHVDYDGSEISLIGNGTDEESTARILAAFAKQYDVTVNDNLYYQRSQQAADWTRALSAWVDYLPAAGPGWIVFTPDRLVVSMEDSKSISGIGEKLSGLGLVFDVNYQTYELAAASKPLTTVTTATDAPVLQNNSIVLASTGAEMLSIEECNQKLRAITQDGSINFRHGSDDLSYSSVQSLAKVRDTLQNCEPGVLTIAGHTDSLGDRQFNLELSATRASLVMDELISQGVEVGRMRAIGFGEDRPIATNDTKAGRWLNRRIEMTLEAQ